MENSNGVWDTERGVWKGDKATSFDEMIPDPLWIFGYGSLCWRSDFPYCDSRPGSIKGFKRRFWQASTDHRGTPDTPGRVATLIESHDSDHVSGIAYKVHPDDVQLVLDNLDFRERGGYSRRVVDFIPSHGEERIKALLYIGTECNPHFKCETECHAGISRTADIISKALGPSGKNSDYLFQLENFLISTNQQDEYIESLAFSVRERMNQVIS